MTIKTVKNEINATIQNPLYLYCKNCHSFLNPHPFITLTLCIWRGHSCACQKQLVEWVLSALSVLEMEYRLSGMAPVPIPLSHLSGLVFCIWSSHLPGESQSLDLMRHFLHKHQRMPRACFWTKSPCAQKFKWRQKLLTQVSEPALGSPFQRPFSSQRR